MQEMFEDSDSSVSAEDNEDYENCKIKLGQTNKSKFSKMKPNKKR